MNAKLGDAGEPTESSDHLVDETLSSSTAPEGPVGGPPPETPADSTEVKIAQPPHTEQVLELDAGPEVSIHPLAGRTIPTESGVEAVSTLRWPLHDQRNRALA